LTPRKYALLVIGAVAVLSLLSATGLVSLPWTHDLDFQVSIKPQEMPLQPPDGVVPITGRIDDGKREDANRLVNPAAASDTSSLRRGQNAFMTYCTPCHGKGGEGNGTVARSLPIPPINLTDAAIQSARSDGSLYYTIRHGNVIMPGYAYALSPERTWDVVRYVRTLKTK
jgi:mono/diheme cytochrome c family protein